MRQSKRKISSLYFIPSRVTFVLTPRYVALTMSRVPCGETEDRKLELNDCQHPRYLKIDHISLRGVVSRLSLCLNDASCGIDVV